MHQTFLSQNNYPEKRYIQYQMTNYHQNLIASQKQRFWASIIFFSSVLSGEIPEVPKKGLQWQLHTAEFFTLASTPVPALVPCPFQDLWLMCCRMSCQSHLTSICTLTCPFAGPVFWVQIGGFRLVSTKFSHWFPHLLPHLIPHLFLTVMDKYLLCFQVGDGLQCPQRDLSLPLCPFIQVSWCEGRED